MLQKISSVLVVYRCKTLTGSPDPTHANGMDKPCKGVRLKVEIMVKHTYFSVKLSILQHPVVTVIKKRRKELNYGQECAFQSKQITTTETSHIGRQERQIKEKLLHFKAHRSTPGYNQDI